ncbi:MAG: insulinase family protein [Candidatus Omnitrophica bacterium]|nr:insulinase family protein [Candidatus Omnitrophota bacterium]
MYSKTVLNNHLRVASHKMKERDSIALGIWVGVGGRYEDDRVKGAVHFLEHILFKGSQKYSCQQIKQEIEGVGGSLNAFTSEEHTCFYAKIPSQHLQRTFDVLADMVFHPLIRSEDVERERGVIVEEIKMYHDLPQYLVLDILDQIMWPEHPLGKSLAGTVETVSKMTAEDLRAFHDQYYIPKNIAVAACGKIRHTELVKLIKSRVRESSQKFAESFLQAPKASRSPQVKIYKKDTEQMHLALGLPGIPYDHKDKYILNLLHVLLGGNMSSRLFDEVREKRGLAYSIGTSVKSLRDTGMFMVRAGVDNTKIVDAVSVILKELQKVKKGAIVQKEFLHAKEFYLGQVLLGLEDTMDHMLWLGESIMTRGYLRTIEEVVKEVKKIKLADVQRVAKEILNEKRLHLALVGPVSDEQEKSLQNLIV